MGFLLGQTVMTCGVNAQMQRDEYFGAHVHDCIRRHLSGDWGDLGDEDKASNDAAINPPGGCEADRIFSAYESAEHPKIWIITEWDRSVTTVLFPDEY